MTLFPHLLVSASLAAALGAGCLGAAYQDPTSGDQGVNGDGGRANGPDMAIDAKALFDANVRPLLLADCGGCHATAGGSYPGFLAAAPDVYTTVINFPGLIGVTPETSRILIKDVHIGPSFHESMGYTPTDKLKADAVVIGEWIKQFNLAGGHGVAGSTDMQVKAHIMPFAPVMGTLKTIDLGELDPKFMGITVSFTPTAVGSTQINLSGLKITATATTGVHVKSPVFARYDAAAPTVTIDIDYDYLNKEFTAFPGSSVTLSPSLTIFAYTAGQLIDLSFEVIEPATGSADLGGAVGMCKNVAGFTTFKPLLLGGATGVALNCNNCHANGNGGFSTNGFGAQGTNDTNNCAATLINANAATPNMSAIYTAITGTKQHAGGKVSAADDTKFLDALTTWLNGEK